MLTRLEMQFSMREDMNVKLASTKVGLNSLCPWWHASQLSTHVFSGICLRNESSSDPQQQLLLHVQLGSQMRFPLSSAGASVQTAGGSQTCSLSLSLSLTTAALAICPCGQKKKKTGTWQNKSVTAQCAKNSEKRIWTNAEQAVRVSAEIVWKTPASKIKQQKAHPKQENWGERNNPGKRVHWQAGKRKQCSKKLDLPLLKASTSVFMQADRKPRRTCKIKTNYNKMNHGPDFSPSRRSYVSQ